MGIAAYSETRIFGNSRVWYSSIWRLSWRPTATVFAASTRTVLLKRGLRLSDLRAQRIASRGRH